MHLYFVNTNHKKIYNLLIAKQLFVVLGMYTVNFSCVLWFIVGSIVRKYIY